MKQFYVHLTYMSLKYPQRIIVEANDADGARAVAQVLHPLAEIRGPSAIIECKNTGNCQI